MNDLPEEYKADGTPTKRTVVGRLFASLCCAEVHARAETLGPSERRELDACGLVREMVKLRARIVGRRE